MDLKFVSITSLPIYVTLALGGLIFFYNRKKCDAFQTFGIIFFLFVLIGMVGDAIIHLFIVGKINVSLYSDFGLIFSLLKTMVWILLIRNIYRKLD